MSAEDAAIEFVLEYLNREVEFIDIAEFVDEEYPELGELDMYKEVANEVAGQLEAARDMWADTL